jgi:hypothetical protein
MKTLGAALIILVLVALLLRALHLRAERRYREAMNVEYGRFRRFLGSILAAGSTASRRVRVDTPPPPSDPDHVTEEMRRLEPLDPRD